MARSTVTTTTTPTAQVRDERLARIEARRLTRIGREMASAQAMCAGHAELLAVAIRLGMEAEIDHQARCVDEWNAELDDVIERAAAAGYGPKDFEVPA